MLEPLEALLNKDRFKFSLSVNTEIIPMNKINIFGNSSSAGFRWSVFNYITI